MELEGGEQPGGVVERVVAVLRVVALLATCAFALLFLTALFFDFPFPSWVFILGLACMLRLCVLGMTSGLLELLHEIQRRRRLDSAGGPVSINPNWN
jgi:hypothetical protein